jgi:hypothetical protein
MARVFSKRDKNLRKAVRDDIKKYSSTDHREKDCRCEKCHREFGVYEIPDEALRLAEDIQTIELVIDLINKLDSRTFNSNDEAGTAIRRLNFILSAIRYQAWDRLRRDFTGSKVKPRRKPQTLADVWQILFEGKDKAVREFKTE